MDEIWCWFFLDGAETNTMRKLEIIRPFVSLQNNLDVELFNFWAEKSGCPIIKENERA